MARLCCTPQVWSLCLSLTPFILRIPLDPAETGPRQSTIFASVSSIEICLLFVPLLESVYFIPVDLGTLNFKSMRQDLKLRNLALFYIWEDARVRVH